MAKKEEKRNLETIPVGSLGVIALKGCKTLGEKVDYYLVKWRAERESEHKDSLAFAGYQRDTYLLGADIPRFGGQLVLPVVIPVQLHGQAVILHRDILGSEDIQPLFARNLNIQASEAVRRVDSCVLVALYLVGLCAVHIGVVGPYSRQQGLLAQGIDIKCQFEKIESIHNRNTPFL